MDVELAHVAQRVIIIERDATDIRAGCTEYTYYCTLSDPCGVLYSLHLGMHLGREKGARERKGLIPK